MRAIIVLFALVTLAITAHAQPAIAVKPASIELGRVAQTRIDTSVTVTNTGAEALVVQNIRTSCGCTSARFATRSLAPGESVVVPVTIDARGKNGDFRTSISVLSNDPANPSLTVAIHGAALAASTVAGGGDAQRPR